MRESARPMRENLRRVLMFRPELAILATLLAGAAFGQAVRAVLPVRPNPAPTLARPAERPERRPPAHPGRAPHAPHDQPAPQDPRTRGVRH